MRIIKTSFFILIFALALITLPVQALSLNDLFGGKESQLQSILGLGAADPLQIVVNLISVAIGFTGILMVAIIMWAGFKWMISGGNDEKIAEAKKTLFSAIIGLLIILSSYAIVQFILNSFFQATTNNIPP